MNLQNLEQAARLADRAEAMLEAGLAVQAARLTEQAITLNPDLSRGRLLQARVELSRHQPKHALRALTAERLAHPDQEPSPESLLLQAKALAQAGKVELAVSCARRLTEKFPDDERAHRVLAGVYAAQGKDALAAQSLRQVHRLSPGDGTVVRTLADLIGSDHPQEAATLLRAEYRKSHDVHVMLRLARVHRQCGQLRDADEAMRGVLGRCPHDASLWHEAAGLSVAMDDLTTAQLRLQQAMRLKTSPQVLTDLATVELRVGAFAKAGRRLWQLTRHGSQGYETICGLMVACLAADKPRLAKRIMRKYGARISRAERRSASARWWCHASQGQAVLLATGGEAERHADTSPLKRLLSRASGNLARESEEHPMRADVHYHYARCLDALEDETRATDHVKKALDINPQYQSAHRLQLHLDGGDDTETRIAA